MFVHRDRLVVAGPALRAHQDIETVGVGTRVGIRYDLPAGAVVGGVRYPPQNWSNGKVTSSSASSSSLFSFVMERSLLESKVLGVRISCSKRDIAVNDHCGIFLARASFSNDP